MSDSLHPSEKVWMFPGCKDDGEDKQHGGKPASQWETVEGSPVVLLERPFIRCSSCWAIYFSNLLAMSLSYGLADPWAKEIGSQFRQGNWIYFLNLLDPNKSKAFARTRQNRPNNCFIPAKYRNDWDLEISEIVLLLMHDPKMSICYDGS